MFACAAARQNATSKFAKGAVLSALFLGAAFLGLYAYDGKRLVK
jgi:hypothetical protein